jgi:hypothetical protein
LRPSIWKTLGISRSQDRTEIRRAYAKQLKLTNPEDDPEGFKVLRAAYEEALDYADNRLLTYDLDEAEDEVAAPDIIAENSQPSRTNEAEIHAPPVVDTVTDSYLTARATLETQLQAKSAASEDDRLASLALILSSPVLDNIEMRSAAEAWLADLVSRNRPRSDALIPRLTERFGWNNRRLDRHQPYAVREVLQRERDLVFLRTIKHSGDSNSDAWNVLSRPPQTPSVWRRLWPKASRSEIQSFLDRVRNDHPTVIDDLNADSVEIWEKGGQTGDLFDSARIWTLALMPVGFLAMLVAWLSWGFHLAILAMLPAIPVAAVAGALAYKFGYARARQVWEQNWRLQQNGVLAFGWGPAIIGVLCLAAAPPSPWLTGIATVLSFAVVWWAAITGEPDRSEHSWPWQIRLVVAELFLVAWWACALWDVSVAAAIQMTPPIIAATLVSGFGRMSLFPKWLMINPWGQRAILVALIAGIAAAIVLLWQSYAVPDWKSPAFACAAVMVLLHRVPTLAIAHWTAGFRYVVAYGALFIARTQGGEMMSLAFAGSVLLAWAGLNTLLALYYTWRRSA